MRTTGSSRRAAAEYTGGASYNGNGFWSDQEDLPGVAFRAPNSGVANQFIDYVHLPFEKAEFITGGAAENRAVRVFFKRNSVNCSPQVTQARIIVYRYADES